jgi:hypothetical protein
VGLNNTGSGKGASTRESEGRESVENEGYTSENPDSQRQSSSGERGSFEASGELGRSLTPEYRRELEEAFVANHHYGSRPESISEAVRSITLQTQMYLQRLNYLSVSYKISGEYDDITLRAVQTFQVPYKLTWCAILSYAYASHQVRGPGYGPFALIIDLDFQ